MTDFPSHLNTLTFSVEDLSVFFDLVVITSQEGALHYTNKKIQRLLGLSTSDDTQINIRSLFEKNSGSTDFEKIMEKVKSIGGWKGEITLKSCNNYKFCFCCSITYLKDSPDNQLIWTGVDISEQKKIEESLIQAERLKHYSMLLQKGEQEKFRMVVEASPNAIVMVDTNSTIALVNVQSEKLFGYSREELLGQKLDMLIPERFRLNHPKHMEEYFKNPSSPLIVARRDLFCLHKNGSEIPVEIGLNPLQTNEGFFVLASIINISERKLIEQMKNEFVSMVSHELRTPLTSIRGSLGLVLGGVAGEINAEAKSLLQIALDSCERLVRLINDILDIEKIESGKMLFKISPQPLIPIIENSIVANQSYANQLGVKIFFENQSVIPYVMADTDRINQVLTNLISNAIKFSPKDEAVFIFIATTEAGKFARISVKDNGRGISEEFRSQIFQKFAQQDASDSRQKGGTGLGLNICKAIVERHGGVIGYDSVPGKGTTFFFTLPLAFQTEKVEQKEILPKKNRFLICTGDQTVADQLSIILEQEGFDVDIASDDQATERLLKEHSFEGMILDSALPGQSSFSLLAELRQDKATEHLPVVVLSKTNSNPEANQNKLKNLSILEWIHTPIDAEKIITTILRCFEKGENEEALILYVEDDEDLTKVVQRILSDMATVEIASTCAEAREKLLQKNYRLVLLDLKLPDGSGLELLPLLRSRQKSGPQVIIFSCLDASIALSERIAAVLMKGETSNEVLRQTVKSLLH